MRRDLRRSAVFALAAFLSPALFAQVTVSLTPNFVGVPYGATQKLTVKVTGTTDQRVTWSATAFSGGAAAAGTISPDGTYNAVSDGPGFALVGVSATSVASPTSRAMAYLILTYPPATISTVSPDKVATGNATVTLSGQSFFPSTKATFAGRPASIQYINATTIRVSGSILPTDKSPVAVSVTNPAAFTAPQPATIFVAVTSPPPATLSTIDAARFLRQTSWGPKQTTLDKLKQMGREAYLDEQFTLPASTYPASLKNKDLDYSKEYLFYMALNGNDQLRQRVAWALSQIFVVSGNTVDCAEAFVPFLNTLQLGAFGNFYDLMRNITLTVAMGEYLNMIDSEKADGTQGTMPNENYARELLQLFTVGLVKLNPDGTPATGSNGQPVPTYGQNEVLALSRVFTGWTYSDAKGQPAYQTGRDPKLDMPMVPSLERHDTGAKTLLDGYRIPAGLSPAQDLETALQQIFRHPNVGPFIGKQLIQRLVTSNPSPAYVRRVAAAFDNDGAGTRGNLKAVIKAIVMDPEASLSDPSAGRLREPALYIAALARALDAKVTDHPYLTEHSQHMLQNVFYAPSVFNYYSPSYRIPKVGLLGPEFQILTTDTVRERMNFAARMVNGSFGKDVYFDWAPWRAALKTSTAALLDRVDLLLLGGQMTSDLRATLQRAVNSVADRDDRIRLAIYLTAISNHFQVEH